MKNKTVFFSVIYFVLAIIIYCLLNQNISSINNNNKLIYNYIETALSISLFQDELPKECSEAEIILNKNLNDDQIKLYEKIELEYYLNKNNKICINSVNNLMLKKFKDLKINLNNKFDEIKYNKIKYYNEKKQKIINYNKNKK